MSSLKNINFSVWLGIVSIIGFITIFVNSITGISLNEWADSLLFLIIGFALFLAGGARFFVYFKNGLTPNEINRIVTVAIGVTSMVTGVLIAPFFNFNFVILDAIKGFIAIIAVAVIMIEIIGDEN